MNLLDEAKVQMFITQCYVVYPGPCAAVMTVDGDRCYKHLTSRSLRTMTTFQSSLFPASRNVYISEADNVRNCTLGRHHALIYRHFGDLTLCALKICIYIKIK